MPVNLVKSDRVADADLQDVVIVSVDVVDLDAWLAAARAAAPGVELQFVNLHEGLGWVVRVGGTDDAFDAFEAWFYPSEYEVF